MTTVIFSTKPGLIAAVDDKVMPALMHITLQGWQGPTAIKSLINRASLDTRTNQQFLHTFGGDAYIDIFGHRIGRMQLGGISLPHSCDNASQTSGIEYVLNYYQQNNLAETGLPVSIVLGTSFGLRAYLQGIQAQMMEPETMQWGFSMDFALIPYTRPHKSLDKGRASSPGRASPVSPTPARPSRAVPAGPLGTDQQFASLGSGPELDLISW